MRWRRLRDRILRRDGYMSLHALRYGRHVEADTVHHVWPAEDYPEYAWEPWNLISVTLQEHRGVLHNADGSLTEEGERWKKRTPPPSSGRTF